MKLKYYHIYLFILLFLTVSACKFGPNYQRSVQDIPEQFRFDPTPDDTLVNLLWWELFEDENLKSLIKIGLQENRDIRLAVARIQEAVAFYGFTKADLYPKVDIVGQAQSGNLVGGQFTGESIDLFLVAPAFSWELDFWGKFRRANEAARAEILATEQTHQIVAISLISEIASTYFLLLDFKNRLEIAERTLESRENSMEIIQARFDQGTIPEIDLNQAQIQKEIAAQSVPRFQRLVGKTENALGILIGRSPRAIQTGSDLYNQEISINVPAGLPSELLNRRPDVLESEYLLEAQSARIGVAVAQRFPSISLTGTYGIVSTDLSNFTDIWSVSGDIFGPLFNFGKNKRRVEIEKYRTEQALMAYEQSILVAFADVEDALIEIQTYRDELNASIRRKDAAFNAKKLSDQRYDGGVTSYLEVLEQERSLFDAELVASEVLQLQLNSYVNLYKALGGGWITEEQAASPGE
jgi:outer membrane protein, multidrug efflux system